MSEFNISQNDFSRGLVSGKIAGRSDLKDYKSALSIFENMLTLPSGGITKRPGFQYVATLEDRSIGDLGTTADCGIIPFMPDDVDSYIVILPSPTSGTFAPQSVSSPGDTSRNIRIILNDGTECTVSLTTGTAPYDFVGSWPWGLDSKGWRFVQSSDYIFITHSSGLVRPFYIVRTARTAFTVAIYNVAPITTVGFIEAKTYPYQDLNASANTLAYDGVATITSVQAIFNSLMKGGYVKMYSSALSRYVYFSITAVPTTSTLTVIPLIAGVPAAITGTTEWALSAWNNYFGFPTVVTIHDQRICWAATKSRFGLSEPDVIWVSRVGNFFRMEDSKDDFNLTYVASSADAIKFRIGGSDNNFITWMVSSGSFQCGTTNAEFVVDFYITESGVKYTPEVKRQTSHGSVNVQPATASYSTLYVTRNKRSVRQFKYNRENGSYIANDLNVLADEIFKLGSTGIRKLIWQEERRLLWCLDGSPFIRVLSFDEGTGVVAWSTVLSTFMYIHDMIALPNATIGEDEIFALAYIDNDTGKTALVKISNFFERGNLTTPTDGDRPYYTDCSVRSYDASTKLVHSGFDILEGLTVRVLADGVDVGDHVVTSGDITLSSAANEVIAGIPYTAAIQTMPIEAGGMFGDSVGTVKRIDEISIRFYRSYAAVFGDRIMAEENSLEAIEFDASKGLFSGLKSVKFANGYSEDYDAYIIVEQNSPTPLTISCITYRGISYK